NPWYSKKAQLAQLTLYDGHRLLQPGHAPVTVSDSHETLLETEFSRMKMSQKPGHVTPVDYTKLNALYDQFVPQKELSKEQVYWLSASDIASQSSDPPKPVTPFVHTRLVNSKDHIDLQVKFQNYKECLHNQKVYEQPNATTSNAIFEINKLKAQLQEKDDTVRHLHAEKDILGLLNVGSTENSFETKALETEIAQLKEGLTSLKIQND
nr:hypothetical protein [Tanacetum cinerariifolium]